MHLRHWLLAGGFLLGVGAWFLLARGLRHATFEEIEAVTPDDAEPPAGGDESHG